MKEAILWKELPNMEVLCYACYRLCRIKKGDVGYCRVRKNVDGKLQSLNYGKAAAYEIDPIEKKPFYHFMPGTKAFSFSTVGCNFRCVFCQNWNISQEFVEVTGYDLPPESIVQMTQQNRAQGIAYTYTEPTVFIEYSLDTAKIARPLGLYNVFVTNGYMTSATIRSMRDVIDASRIDLKGFYGKVYKELSGDANVEYVLQSIKELYREGHVEIIYLMIPGYNDENEEIRAAAKWIFDLDRNIPLHFTAFFPAYKAMSIPPTQLDTLLKARAIAIDEGLRYVYTGNIMNKETESTYCWNCNERIVERMGFEVFENKVTPGGTCPQCGKRQYFVNDLELYRKRKLE